MNTPPAERPPLSHLAAAAGVEGRWLWDGEEEVSLAAATGSTRIGLAGERRLQGARVLVHAKDQLGAALALLDLDGVAATLVVAPPELSDGELETAVRDAQIDAVYGEVERFAATGLFLEPPSPPRGRPPSPAAADTHWMMYTSGTSGRPKMVSHTLPGLVGAIPAPIDGPRPVWGTFYDIRRYGGLQMLFRALLTGGSMILPRPAEALASVLERLGARSVSHLSGTPSHWRRALMSPAISRVEPRYVRLSGEIADQGLLDRLKVRFPAAALAHAFASTEAGVGFEVDDGLEGFPAEFLERRAPSVEISVRDGSLRLRSPRTALGYLGAGAEPLHDADGWVDTGDLVERRDDRFYFLGRRGGVINVGGQKFSPEEVEAVLNRQEGVRVSRVSARRSPITGALVVADVVAESAPSPGLRAALQAACREALPRFKIPTSIRFVDALEMTQAGKLDRRHA